MSSTSRLAVSLFIALGTLMTTTIGTAADDGRLEYIETRRGDQIDDYHGAKVPDPYRWLEDDVRQSSEVAAWVKAQNEVTFGYLKSLPHREAIERRLTQLWNYQEFSAPSKVGGRYFFFKNDGLQNQDVLYVQE